MSIESKNKRLAGFLVEFRLEEHLLCAVEDVRKRGYTCIEAYTPRSVEGLSEKLGDEPTRVPLCTLLGGIGGACLAYFTQWYATVIDYPLNIGGRPIHAVPAFVPLTFEIGVLGAGLMALLSFLWECRLPKLHHPVFEVPAFARASQDAYFLGLFQADPLFDQPGTRAFLDTLGARGVYELPA